MERLLWSSPITVSIQLVLDIGIIDWCRGGVELDEALPNAPDVRGYRRLIVLPPQELRIVLANAPDPLILHCSVEPGQDGSDGKLGRTSADLLPRQLLGTVK